MNLVALGDYALIEKISQGDRQVQTVIVPQSQQSLISKGKVISIGTGKKIKDLELKVGDTIYYNEIANNSYASADPTGNDVQVFPVRHDFFMIRDARKKE